MKKKGLILQILNPTKSDIKKLEDEIDIIRKNGFLKSYAIGIDCEGVIE